MARVHQGEGVGGGGMSRDIVVTVPAKLWFNWLCEGDLPGDPEEEKGTWDFYTSRAPTNWQMGQRVYVVAHGYLRGYGEMVGRQSNALVRSGPGVACTLFENGKPKPMRGFQGWRYATWAREEVRGWEGVEDGWARYGLPTKLANDIMHLFHLRSDVPHARKVLREASLTVGVNNYNEAYRVVDRANLFQMCN